MELQKLDKMTRPPLERIVKIHERINSGSFPNCRTMAEELSVDEDTIGRDIFFMRTRWGVPIEYDRSKHGYYYDGPVKDFLHFFSISEQELFAVVIVEKTVREYEGTPFYQPLRMLFEKLKQFLSPGKKYALKNLHHALSCRPLSPEDSNYHAFKTVSDAIERQRGLTYLYRKHDSKEISERTLHPYALVCVDQRWYVIGLDLLRNNVQSYVLRRMDDLVITKDKFTVLKDFNLDNYLIKRFRMMGGTENHEVIVEFDSWGTDIVCDRRWHPTQVLEQLPEGRCRITMQLSSLEEVEGWIMSHGIHATVIQPQELCDRIEKTAGELNARYEKLRRERLNCASGKI